MWKRLITIAAMIFSVMPSVRAADGMIVPLGAAMVLRLEADAGHVVLGNPAVADVTMQSFRTLVLFGKTAGGTSLLVTDRRGGVILQTALLVTASSDQGVTLHYGTGKNWQPGGSVAGVECGSRLCAPAVAVPGPTTTAPPLALPMLPPLPPPPLAQK